MRKVWIITFLACFAGSACRDSGTKQPALAANPATRAAVSGYEVVNTWPHARDAYTQGLIFHDGRLLESTGQNGSSSLRRVELETGKVIQKVDVPAQYFAEGLTLLGGKIYQLTWEHGTGFIYDPWSFEKIGEFHYYGEGWGLTHDGEFLILSDGTNRLRFMDPQSFQVKKTITVLDQGTPIGQLNELEYANGEILANVWHTDRIVRIDPQTGKVVGWIDLTGLLAKGEVRGTETVLNGIAYDNENKRLFVTGKLWPKLFEVRIKSN
jgi:glutamine cyclotransferase